MEHSYLIDATSEATMESLARDLSSPGQGLLAFVGAGVSRQAGLPLWKELMVDMDAEVEKIRKRPQQVRAGVLQHADLLWQAELFRLELERRSVYEKYLRKRFRRNLPPGDSVIRGLARLKFRHFLTTNYDTFLEQALGAENQEYDEFDWTNRQECRDFFLNYLSPTGPRYVVHIHGRSDQPQSIVLTHRDYVRRYVETMEYVEKLSILFATLRLVFVGFGLEDPDLRFILRQVNSRFGAGDVQHYAVLGFNRANEAQAQIERERLERQFGIASIFYDDANGHAALKDVLQFLEPPEAAVEFSLPAPEPPRKTITTPAVSWNDDPHKGRFGGSPVDRNNTRRLSAQLRNTGQDGLYAIRLLVESIGGTPLQGIVTFHVHPTFARQTYERPAVDGTASLDLEAYGAFTVGAECDDHTTLLELDLAELEFFPQSFRMS